MHFIPLLWGLLVLSSNHEMETWWTSQQYNPTWLPLTLHEALSGSCKFYLYLATLTHQTELLLLWTTSRWEFLQEQNRTDILRCPPKLGDTTETWSKATPPPIPGHMGLDSTPRRNVYSLVTRVRRAPELHFLSHSKISGKRMDKSRALVCQSPPLSCMRKPLLQAHTKSNLQYIAWGKGACWGVESVLELYHGDSCIALTTYQKHPT